MIQQNIALCFIISAMGGVTTIAARAVVLKQVQREKKGLGSRYEKRLASLLFFLLEGSSHVCSFLAPWFGPASLVLPTEGSSKLLSNVLVVGAILQHEKFDKRTLVGTAMVAIGVIYLPINGPKPQDNQDLVELIVQDPVALVWLSTTFSCYIVSVLTMFCCDLKKFQPRAAETVLLLVSTFSKLGNAVSKCASLSEQYGSVARGTLLAVCGIMISIWIIQTMKEPLYVRSFATYVPTDTVVGLFFNFCSGVRTSSFVVVAACAGGGVRGAKPSRPTTRGYFLFRKVYWFWLFRACVGGRGEWGSKPSRLTMKRFYFLE
jgi:uncharacterized membrane protein